MPVFITWNHGCCLPLSLSLILLSFICCWYTFSPSSFSLPSPSLSSTSPPDVFLLGTAKSGTTELYHLLYHLLIQHPKICHHPTKELHFFDRNISSFDPTSYWQMFRNCPRHLLMIDASPNYFRDNVSFYNFKKFYTASEIRNKKYILILRDPIAREISWFYHVKRKCLQFHTTQQKPPPRYKCLANKSDEITTNFEEYLFSDRFQPWGSMYSHQLQRWLTIIQRKQIFILEMNTLWKSTSLVLNRIFAFLNLPTIHSISSFDKRKENYQSSYNKTVGSKSMTYLRHLYSHEMMNLLTYLKESKTPYELEFQGFD